MAISIPFSKVPDGGRFMSSGVVFIKVLEESELYNAVSEVDSAISVNFTQHWPVIMYFDDQEEHLKAFLPEWAEGLNRKRSLVVGAQLQTRDGRRTGNAHIHKVEINSKVLPVNCYCVRTDIGNTLLLTEAEVHELFYIGPYLVKLSKVENVSYSEAEPG